LQQRLRFAGPDALEDCDAGASGQLVFFAALPGVDGTQGYVPYGFCALAGKR
jgi:hypothetical protein